MRTAKDPKFNETNKYDGPDFNLESIVETLMEVSSEVADEDLEVDAWDDLDLGLAEELDTTDSWEDFDELI
jgi:hypothetical protein